MAGKALQKGLKAKVASRMMNIPNRRTSLPIVGPRASPQSNTGHQFPEGPGVRATPQKHLANPAFRKTKSSNRETNGRLSYQPFDHSLLGGLKEIPTSRYLPYGIRRDV